jgi:hypothetical protein
MPLALFEQQVYDISLQPQGLGQRDPIGRRRARRGFSDSQGRPFTHRHNLRHRCVTVQHRDCLPLADCAEVFA